MDKRLGHQRRRELIPISRITIEHLWVLALLAAAFTLVSVRPVPPHDFWWHARVGQQIVQQRAIPTVDTFSFTAQGRPMFYQSWLSEVLLYALLRFGGLPWTILAQALLVTATYGGLYWLCRDASRGNFRLAVFTTLWALFAASNNWAIRPQSFSFLPFLLFLWVLRRHARGLRAPLWILPAVMVLWVNLHGAFILGPILAVLALLGMVLDRLRVSSRKVGAHPGGRPTTGQAQGRGQAQGQPLLKPLVVATAALFPAMLINPRGPGVVQYVVSLLTNPPSQQLIMEWRQPDIHGFQGRLFYTLLLVCLLTFAKSIRRLRWADLLPFLAFAWMGLTSIRYVVWFGLIAAPLLTETLAVPGRFTQSARWAKFKQGRWGKMLFEGQEGGYAGFTLLIVVLILLEVAIALPWNKSRLPLPPAIASLTTADTPVAATRYLLDHDVPGPLFHDMGYGSYLIWAAWPRVQVFADPRVELYPLDQWLDYAAISTARYDYEGLLDGYGIQSLMVDRVSQPALVAAVSRPNSGWKILYDDGRTMILERSP
ncbi:MAG: hypothetical protein GXP41_09415 [Chloroflexi bacterium]|nr:hypothetical protein [Chloroflexota bacterium]